MRCQAAAPLALLCAAVLALLLASASAAPGPGRQVQTKPRTIRGFKNVVLSTARNFGKRAGASLDGAGSQGEFVDEATMQANGAEYQRAPGNSFPFNGSSKRSRATRNSPGVSSENSSTKIRTANFLRRNFYGPSTSY